MIDIEVSLFFVKIGSKYTIEPAGAVAAQKFH